MPDEQPPPMTTGPTPDPDATPDTRAALRAFVALHDIACPSCGFNLRGCAEERCPECGEVYGAYLMLGAPAPGFAARATRARAFGGMLLAFAAVAHLSVGAVGLTAGASSAFSFGYYGAWTNVVGHLIAGAVAAGVLACDRVASSVAPRSREVVRIIGLIAIVLLSLFSLAPALLSAVLALLTMIGGAP